MIRNTCSVWATVLAAFFFLSTPVWAEPDTAARAESLIDNGAYAEAAALIEPAIAVHPDDAALWFLLGLAYHNSGEADLARRAFEKVVSLDPNHTRAWYNLGAIHYKARRWGLAEEAFVHAARSPELAATGYLNAGLSRYKGGDPEGARPLFDEASRQDPSGRYGEAARRMLAHMEDPEGAAIAGERETRSAGRPEKSAGAWRIRFEAGREYDTNVFLSPDDQTTSNSGDWRTEARARIERQLPVLGHYRLTTRYDFSGRWYNSKNQSNLTTHRLRLRLDERRQPLRLRLEYVAGYSELRGNAYQNSHRFAVRARLLAKSGRYLWAGAELEMIEAPGSRYDYLSGTGLKATLSTFGPFLKGGQYYGALSVHHLDRGTLTSTSGALTTVLDYSYIETGPYLRLSMPTGWHQLEVAGTFRYQYRSYLNEDVWSGGPAGSKTRKDHRVGVGLEVSREVFKDVEVSFEWEGEVRRSNIGDDANDYRDRDYNRNVFGVFATARF
ncbi:MAG: tetratricopeptide repeat protein [Leptospirillia bacterium]